MEVNTAAAQATGSRTIADLLPLAVERFGDQPAQRYKVGEDWKDVSYAELGGIVREVSLGLVDLGLEAGDKVSILAHTRPEWTQACFGLLTAGCTLVTIYQTNSPEECQYVAGHSESRAIFVEDAEQLAKIREVRDELPDLEFIIVLDPAGTDLGDDAIALDQLRERGHGRDEEEFAARYSAVTPEDFCLYIYTSGTTGPPKGCLLTHANYRAITDAVVNQGVIQPGDSTYLFLPLAHAFAILIQFATLDLGATLAYWSKDPQQIIPELTEVNPTYFPSVPRMFEKIYTLATTAAGDPAKLRKSVELGVKVRQLREQGEEVPAELQQAFDGAEEGLYKNVRALFGTNMRECVTGAAPIAKEILEFFWGCGIPVMEGYGMTETSTVATNSTPEAHKFGTVGRPLPGVDVKIAEDGELLIKGANIFRGYYKNDDASFGTIEDGWLHTGDLGSMDEDGYVSITGRKKDIIITAGGKNLTPANLENDLKQTRWVSQAVMHGDRRPFPVMLITLDEEEIVPWAQQHDIEDTSIAALAEDPQVRELIQGELDKANAKYAQVEQVKKFVILDHDLSQETGELTPTLKVKRNVVNEKYAPLFDRLYER
jgi:long-chain acyl-CoA synthetase